MIIWLASYPKSGNTWLRSIICSILYSKNGLFQFELLKKIKQFPSQDVFKDFTSEFNNINEIKKFWILAQEKINLNNEINFLKTHHINCKIDNYSFSNKSNTLATIYIVRDPRNLVNSISNHYSKSLEEAKEFLLTPKYLFGFKKDNSSKKNNIKTILGTWSEHYKFWKTNNENFLLIKYENLIKDTYSELNKIIMFLKKFTEIEINETKTKNILNSTNFEYLKNLEEKGKFNENAFENAYTKKKFFYLGPENNWENILDDEIKKELESKLSYEMKELGYL